MNYIIQHANGECTSVQTPLTIEDLFALIKKNEDRFILFNEDDDIVFLGTDYLKSCAIMADKGPEPKEIDSMNN